MNITEITRIDSKNLRYQGDIISNESHEVLGSIEYSIQVAIPVPLAIRAFKERTFALNLKQVQATGPSLDLYINNLNIELGQLLLSRELPFGQSPSIYGVLHFEPANHPLLTGIKSGSYETNLEFKAVLPLRVNSDLDRYLRTGKMMVILCDDIETEFVFGYCKINLESLSRSESIVDVVDVQSANGQPCGTLSLKIWWDEPYHLSKPPMITLLDDDDIKKEMDVDVIPKIDDLSLKPLNEISFLITALTFNMNSEIVQKELEYCKQIFFGIDFLGLPGEFLESESLKLPSDGALKTEFSKGNDLL